MCRNGYGSIAVPPAAAIKMRAFGLFSPLTSFLTATGTSQVNTLSLHDALPISLDGVTECRVALQPELATRLHAIAEQDRKSTRLNSSHSQISYAVFCLKKKTDRSLRSLTSSCSRYRWRIAEDRRPGTGAAAIPS